MSGREREVKDFYFKQLRKVEVGDLALPSEARVSLLACSSLHGLTFLATRTGVCVFETAVLDEVDKTASGPRSAHVDLASLKAREFPTPSPPLHLSLSCDSLTLCLVWRENNILSLNFFDTRAVVQATGSPLLPFCSIAPSSASGAGVAGLQWNPAAPDLLAVSLSSGGLYVLEVREDVKVVARDTDTGATCLCWSPKGKQLVLGLKDGSIVQFSHKTGAVKQRHACPDAFGGVPQQVADIHWVSTFLFAVVFTPSSGPGHTPTSLFLSTPKEGGVSWSNFDDVYYGGSARANHFYFTHLSPWNLFLTSSANALETVVFSELAGGGANWERWELDDCGRAEVPLSDGEETHVAGMALSLCSSCDVQISENLTVPPSPLLLLHSTAGVLCPFWVVHEGKGRDKLAAVVAPPTPLPAGPPRVALGPSPPPPQPASTGSQFSVGTILAAAASSHKTVPATPAPIAAPSSILPPSFPPPPQPVLSLGPTPPSGAVRPPHPTSTIPFGQPPPSGAVRPPHPTSTIPFGQPPPSGAVRPPPPTSTIPFGQPPPSGAVRPPPPTSTISFGQPPPSGAVRPPPPTSTIPFGQPPPSGAVRPPPPTSAILFGQPPPSGAVHPPPPTSTIPFGQPPPSGAVRPPPPTSAIPFWQPPPTSTIPFGKPPSGAVRPLPPTPFGQPPWQPPSSGAVRPPLPTSTIPLGQTDASKGTPSDVTVKQLQVSPRQPLLPAGPEIVTVRPQVAGQPLPPAVSGSPRPPARPAPSSGAEPPPTSSARGAAPLSKDDSVKLEAAFSAHIGEEIERFVLELEDFKESVGAVLGEQWEDWEEGGGVAGLGSARDAVEVREEREEVGRAVQEPLKWVKELADACDQLRDQMLRGLELSEKARVSVQRGGDREHILRQKVRPLDPANTKRLSDIRELFLRVDQKTGEVNGQLDAEMQKRRVDSVQRGRPALKPPSIQTVYASLRDHNKIIKLQEEKAAEVVKDMKRLRFIPMSWSPDQSTPPPPPTAVLTQQLEEREAAQPDKLEKLREYLTNIEKTPVKRVRPRPLASLSGVTPSILSEGTPGQSIGSGRSSPASSIPHYLVSGSTPQLYKKTASSLAHVAALASQNSTSCLEQVTQPSPPPPSPPPPPPPSSSGHTVSWGAPPPTGGGVASSGLPRAEGQFKVSSLSPLPQPRPGASGSGVILPFSLSILSSTSQPPQTSKPVLSALPTPNAGRPPPPQPPSSQPMASSLFRPSLAPTPQGTIFSPSSSGLPGSRPPFIPPPPPPSSTRSPPEAAAVSHSPFVFGATSQSSTSLQAAAGRGPATPPQSSPPFKGGPLTVPGSPMGFSFCVAGHANSSAIATSTTTPPLALGVTARQTVATAPLNVGSTVASTNPPVSTMVPPVSTVASTNPPVSTMVPPVSTTKPVVSAVVSTNPPVSTTKPVVSTVASTNPPVSTTKPVVSTVASTNPPVSTMVPPASTTKPVVSAVVSTKPVVSAVASTKPVVSSTHTPESPASTSVPLVVSTTPSPVANSQSAVSTKPATAVVSVSVAGGTSSMTAVASGPALTLGSQQPVSVQPSTGAEEMEDDMDEVAGVGSQSLPSSTSAGGGGLFGGGLGGLGLGGAPRPSAAAGNPFAGGDTTSAAVGSTLFSGAASSSTGGVGGGVAGRPPFSLGSQPLFGQSPQFGQHSLFGATGGSGLSGGPPPFSFRGGFAGAASRMEDISFGALASQESGGLAGNQGHGFSSGSGGTGFAPSSLSGSSFSGWRQ